MRNTLSTSCILLTVMLCACGDDGAAVDDGEGSTSNASTALSAGSGEEPTTGEEPEPEPFVAIPARGGVKISRVEANPGVAVPIGLDGAEVGGAGRNAFIPRERDTLIRVFVDVPDGWSPRELEARLVLSLDGVDTTLTQKLLIEGDTRESGLNSGFYFGIPQTLMLPGLRYQVSLWETDFGQEALPEPEEPARMPLTGTAFVGVESSTAKMRLVLVPIDYNFGSCSRVVDGAEHQKKFENALYQQNPLKELEFTIREPYKVTFDMATYNGLSRLVSEMSQLRTADGADPSVYYYGLFDNCGTCINGGVSGGCTVGLAADITGPTISDARFRASVGQLNSGAADTFVHEVGHTQGRRHIACAGAGVQAQGTDGTYPHEDGRIGVWGFGVRDFNLRHPTVNSDYMSYCGQTWVSDWQWNATYKRILILSGWDSASVAPPSPSPAVKTDGVLIGAVDPSGQQIWWTGPGDLSEERPLSATHMVVFEFADGEVELPAQVSVREHYPTRNIVARLPEGFDGRELLGIRLRDEAGEHETVSSAAIRRLHAIDSLKPAH